MLPKLKKLSCLIDFESAARWGSFKLAAKELHKTSSAVSQQIKQLEEQLGFSLFERHPRFVQITEKGIELQVTVTNMLKTLNQKVETLRVDCDHSKLRISTTHSFSMKWLVPRLSDFIEKYPTIDLHLESTDRTINLTSDPCDIAIRYAPITENSETNLLYREKLVAVYSPVLASNKTKQLTLQDVKRTPLLYEVSNRDWLRWLKLNNMLSGKHDFNRSYSHAGILVQAAVAGQGIALVPYSIAYDDLTSGTLKLLKGQSINSRFGYYFMTTTEKSVLEKITIFKSWLKSKILKMRHV